MRFDCIMILFFSVICNCDLSSWQTIDAEYQRDSFCDNPQEWICEFIQLFGKNMSVNNVTEISQAAIEIL